MTPSHHCQINGPQTNGSPWRLEGCQAAFQSGVLRGEIDLGRPQDGARISSAADGQIGWLWRRTNPAQQRGLDEAYVRGTDLVAAYAPISEFPFREEFYWRIDHKPQPSGAPAELGALISLQTQLLDTSPEVWVESSWRGSQSIALSGSAVLHRLAGGLASVVETVDPSDLSGLPSVVPAADGTIVRWSLCCPFLEKGVIRRARLGVLVMPQEDDARAAHAWLQQFATRGVELTA